MKTCKKCQAAKPEADYYDHDTSCKECRKVLVRARYWAKRDEIIAYDRQRAMLPHRVAQRKLYIQTPEGKRARSRGNRNYVLRYPEKKLATTAVRNAIKRGELVRQPCEKCGEVKSQAHHDDYSKPLSVRWLCSKHHREHHKNMKMKHEAAA